MNERNFGRLVSTTKPKIDAQCDRLNDLHLTLYDASNAFQALADGNLPEAQAQSTARLCAFAMQSYAKGIGEDAVQFASHMQSQIDVADDANETARASRAKGKEPAQ